MELELHITIDHCGRVVGNLYSVCIKNQNKIKSILQRIDVDQHWISLLDHSVKQHPSHNSTFLSAPTRGCMKGWVGIVDSCFTVLIFHAKDFYNDTYGVYEYSTPHTPDPLLQKSNKINVGMGSSNTKKEKGEKIILSKADIEIREKKYVDLVSFCHRHHKKSKWIHFVQVHKESKDYSSSRNQWQMLLKSFISDVFSEKARFISLGRFHWIINKYYGKPINDILKSEELINRVDYEAEEVSMLSNYLEPPADLNFKEPLMYNSENVDTVFLLDDRKEAQSVHMACALPLMDLEINITMPIEMFSCKGFGLIPYFHECNGRVECPDGADEQGCQFPRIISHQEVAIFYCDYANKYFVSWLTVCDSVEDCANGKDELYCPNQTRSQASRNLPLPCLDHLLPCNMRGDDDGEGECYNFESLCQYDLSLPVTNMSSSGILPCSSGKHLMHLCDDVICSYSYKCFNSYCIPLRRLCDHVIDCPQGK